MTIWPGGAMLASETPRKPGGHRLMRSLVIGATATLLLVAVCTPVHGVTADTSGPTAPADSAKEFVARVVGDAEDVWDALFKAMAMLRTRGLRLFSSPGRCLPRAALCAPLWGPSTVRLITRYTSTRHFLARCPNALARPETSLRPT